MRAVDNSKSRTGNYLRIRRLITYMALVNMPDCYCSAAMTVWISMHYYWIFLAHFKLIYFSIQISILPMPNAVTVTREFLDCGTVNLECRNSIQGKKKKSTQYSYILHPICTPFFTLKIEHTLASESPRMCFELCWCC